MRHLATVLLAAIAAVVVLTIGAMVVLPWIVDTPRVQSLIASSASQALARPVKFQSLSVSVLPYPAARLGRIEVAEDPSFGPGPFLRLDEADLRLKLWPLLRGRVEFATLVLKQPRITLVRLPDGRWNLASLGTARETVAVPRPSRGGGGGAPAALVSRILVEDGLVAYEARGADGASAPQRLDKVSLTVTPRAGALSFSGSARATPGDIGVRISDGALGLSGARTLADASLRAQLTLDAKDVQPVAAATLGPEPGVSGKLTGRLSVTGTVGRPRATGEIELENLEVARTTDACPEPRRRRLAFSAVKASVSWDDGRLVVQPLATGIGGGSITSKVTAAPTPRTHAEVSDLAVRGVPLERVLVDFLCQAYAVIGPLDLSGNLAASAPDVLRSLSGEGQLHIGRGKVVGARALDLFGGIVRVGSSASGRDPAAGAASPLEFEAISATYQIRDGVVTTKDFLFASRTLKARVAGDYALPTGQVNLDVVVDSPVGQLRAKVTGSAASPSIRVTPATILRQVDSAKVERGLQNFLKNFR